MQDTGDALTVDVTQSVNVTALFPECEKTVAVVASTRGYSALDFDAVGVPTTCRIGKPMTIRFELPATVPRGTQAEIFVSSDSSEATILAQHNSLLIARTTAIDTTEHLLVEPFFKPMTGETKSVVESMRVKAVTSCAKNDSSCPVYSGVLGLFDTEDAPVSTFLLKGDSAVVKAVRGKYRIKTAAGEMCTELSGKVETSKGVMNEVTVICPSP